MAGRSPEQLMGDLKSSQTPITKRQPVDVQKMVDAGHDYHIGIGQRRSDATIQHGVNPTQTGDTFKAKK
jgi:hypothetical protein